VDESDVETRIREGLVGTTVEELVQLGRGGKSGSMLVAERTLEYLLETVKQSDTKQKEKNHGKRN
jgi:hypothetical protein